jgi:hypothetical protein
MSPSLAKTEFAHAVFLRLERLRERNPQPKTPWSQDWESFLEEADLPSAEEAEEARRVAFALVHIGLLELKLRRDGERPQRFVVPLARERDWFAAFRQTHPADLPNDEVDLRSVEWVPALSFLSSSRTGIALEDLLRLNKYLEGRHDGENVPIKERSLEIFGDEKRLDELRGRSLFRADRLTLDVLRCEVVGEPLGWKRGPKDTGAVLVVENAATWHSYCRWNEQVHAFGAIVYGKGLQCAQSTRYLAEILAELTAPQRIFYFGDLDTPGLQIPQLASAYAEHLGLPRIQPHLPSYHWLLHLGDGKSTPWEGSEMPVREFCDWLMELAQPAWEIVSAGKRLPQEYVGWEFLRGQTFNVA